MMKKEYGNYIMKEQGINLFLEIIDEYEDNIQNGNKIMECILEQINYLIDENIENIEKCYIQGVLPYILRLSRNEYSSDVRL
jgi:hypothetical protein